MAKNNSYNLVVENRHSTVVAEYTPSYKRDSHYQSEAELERAFIKQLEAQAYEYIDITSEDALVLNLRKQLERLNNFYKKITFTIIACRLSISMRRRRGSVRTVMM